MSEAKPRRANGKGTVALRADGRWWVRVRFPGGVRKSYYARSEREAQGMLRSALKAANEARMGWPLEQQRRAVAAAQGEEERKRAAKDPQLGAYLAAWIGEQARTLQPTTLKRYRGFVERVFIPALGERTLSSLTGADFSALYDAELARGLTTTTVHQEHAVLHKALHDAVRRGLLPYNPVDQVKAPRIAAYEYNVLSLEEGLKLLAAAKGDPLEALYVLALTTGMRQGEALALRWRDVDLERGTVSVHATLHRERGKWWVGETKTRSSRRLVALGALGVDALREHRAGARDVSAEAFVFCDERGEPVNEHWLRRVSFAGLLERAGVQRVRYHDLRHAAISFLVGAGVNPRIVADQAGHSSVHLTLSVYSHMSVGRRREAADSMDALLRGQASVREWRRTADTGEGVLSPLRLPFRHLGRRSDA